MGGWLGTNKQSNHQTIQPSYRKPRRPPPPLRRELLLDELLDDRLLDEERLDDERLLLDPQLLRLEPELL